MKTASFVATALILIALPSPAAAQSNYCWTCQEYMGCVLSNAVVEGWETCTTQYTEPQGCWHTGTCYTWVGPIPASFGMQDEPWLSLKKRRADQDMIVITSCGRDGPSREAPVRTAHAVKPIGRHAAGGNTTR